MEQTKIDQPVVALFSTEKAKALKVTELTVGPQIVTLPFNQPVKALLFPAEKNGEVIVRLENLADRFDNLPGQEPTCLEFNLGFFLTSMSTHFAEENRWAVGWTEMSLTAN